MGLSKFPDAVQNIKRNKDLNHECKIFVEPKFASLTQPAFSRPLLFFTFILSISALLVWHFCFLKTFMKLQSKANEQKNNIIRKAVYARTPAHKPEVVFWVISSCSSNEIWFLCDLTKTLSLRLNIIGLTRTHDICQKYTSMPSEENDSTQNTQIASLSSSYGNSVNVFDIISTE